MNDIAFQVLAGATDEAGTEIVQVLQLVVELAARVQAQQPLSERVDIAFMLFEAPANERPQIVRRFFDHPAAADSAFSEDFCAGTRSSRAKISDEIADGEIDFMAD